MKLLVLCLVLTGCCHYKDVIKSMQVKDKKTPMTSACVHSSESVGGL
jgi:hypothetical protein